MAPRPVLHDKDRMSWHRRLLEATPQKTEWYLFDDDGNVALETKWHDLGPIHEIAKAVNAMYDRPTFKKGPNGEDLHHVAFIPEAVQEHYFRAHGVNLLNDKDRIRHWCNQPENSGFRTKPGRV